MYGRCLSRTDSGKKSTDALAAYHFNKKAQSCRCLLHCFCHIDILLHRHFCPTKETILKAHFVNHIFFNWPCWQVTLEKKLNWALKKCQVPQCKLVILNFKISNMLLNYMFSFCKKYLLTITALSNSWKVMNRWWWHHSMVHQWNLPYFPLECKGWSVHLEGCILYPDLFSIWLYCWKFVGLWDQT